MLGRNKKKKSSRSDYSPKMLLNENTPFAVTEAYKTLRTNTIFTLAAVAHDAPHRNIFAVTSSVPGEGKSLTSANLAISFSQTGSRVLLVDADMRKPVQHRTFGIDNDTGLSTVLLALDKMASMIHKNVRPGLDIITSGPIPPNPSELLGSRMMSDLIKRLSAEFDYIIVDLPPVTTVVDPIAVSPNLDGILLVVRHTYTKKRLLNQAMRQLRFANVRVLGFVYNGYSKHSSGYYRRKNKKADKEYSSGDKYYSDYYKR